MKALCLKTVCAVEEGLVKKEKESILSFLDISVRTFNCKIYVLYYAVIYYLHLISRAI